MLVGGVTGAASDTYIPFTVSAAMNGSCPVGSGSKTTNRVCSARQKSLNSKTCACFACRVTLHALIIYSIFHRKCGGNGTAATLLPRW
jgi:hypothetical protein